MMWLGSKSGRPIAPLSLGFQRSFQEVNLMSAGTRSGR